MQSVSEKSTLSISMILSVCAVVVSLAVLSGCTSAAEHMTKYHDPADPAPVSAKQYAVAEKADDFAFPSRPPQMSLGKQVYQQNCASCHVHSPVTYSQVRNEKPIDTYLMLSRGDHGHPTFRNLTRDQRWEAIFYTRFIGGDGDIKNPQIAAIFGSNCAVCHGAKGFADGPLYTGHASAHELGLAPVKGDFFPPPANFHSYSRMYNRTDDLLVKHIKEGVYPSAMPSWYGLKDKDKNFTFDDALITDLVKYVRTFSYENDLPAPAAPAGGASAGGAGGKTSATAPAKTGKTLSALPSDIGLSRLEKP